MCSQKEKTFIKQVRIKMLKLKLLRISKDMLTNVKGKKLEDTMKLG